MIKPHLLLLNLFWTTLVYGQTTPSNAELNLDFEQIGKANPVGWMTYGSSNYILGVDSATVQNGKYSAFIEYIGGETDYKAWGFAIPENYEGKRITLSGFIKTENVTDGFAGLWIRADPDAGYVDMSQKKVTGTTDWAKYEITLTVNASTKTQIVIGGMLVGKGKMWMDHLTIKIDQKDISLINPLARKETPAQNDKEFDTGSKITHLSTDLNALANLKTLGFIWGFLKYHHPVIATGKYNWDYELFRILPKLENIANKQERDNLLVDWIKNLGPFAVKEVRFPKSENIKMAPDVEWITTSGFSAELRTLLMDIRKAARPGQHYYIELNSQIGNPQFKNEEAYGSMNYPDAGFRILALYRYWNIIHYYFPYKNLIGEDWKNVLEEFIPEFINAADEKEYTFRVSELIGRIHDSHAVILGNNRTMNNYFGVNYAPVEVTFIENKPAVTGFYKTKPSIQTRLELGDVITRINHQPIDEVIRQRLRYTPGSNYSAQLRDVAQSLLRTNDSTITLHVMRNNEEKHVTVQAFSLKNITISSKYYPTDTCFKYVAQGISYINNSSLKRAYLPKVLEEIKKSKGLIIDNRNYPTDFLLEETGTFLLPNKRPFVKFTNGSIANPGLFTFTKPVSVGKKNKNFYKGKVVILINEISQSSAEFHTMAYRVSPNAIVMGSATAGADGNVSKFYLPGGISTWISGLGVYYPDGKDTQRIGILPDIEVKPTLQGVKQGRDELIEKAVEMINSQHE